MIPRHGHGGGPGRSQSRGQNAPLQRISRRGLITSGVLAGVLAATGVPVHARTAGGHLRLALPGRFRGWGQGLDQGLDQGPDRGSDQAGDLFARVAHQGAVFDSLTEVAATGELTGELAISWQAEEAGAVWTFRLRPGVAFHDGRPLTARDVLDSLARQRGHWIMARARDLSAPAPDLIRIALHDPDPDWPFLMADPALLIAPAGQVADGIGTGLYRAGEARDGALHLCRARPHYRDGQAGWFDAVTLRPTDSAAERAALLAMGEVDAAVDAATAPPGFDTIAVAAHRSLLLVTPPGLDRDPALALARQSPQTLAALGQVTGDLPRPVWQVTLSPRLRHGGTLGTLAPADSARAAERWWFA
jgi:peptide/nickel transport system substrate-binding protein